MTKLFISNPATYAASPDDTKSLKFCPGAHPFVLRFDSGGMVHLSALVFAANECGVREKLKSLCRHRRECAEGFEKNVGKAYRGLPRWVVPLEDILRQGKQTTLHEGDEYTLLIEPAPKNQFYRIGWASNDTF